MPDYHDNKYPPQTFAADELGSVPGEQRFRRAGDYKLDLTASLHLPKKQRAFNWDWRFLLLALAIGAALGVFSFWPHQAGAAALPFRLHIIANSDSAADQAVKLQVRDAVVEYLTPLLAEVDTQAEAEAIVTRELPQLERLAAGITADFGYGAAGEIGTFGFPAKRYGHIVMPAGDYRALRLVLGEGAGHNWWCVLFPPLCFVDECGTVCARDAAAADDLLAGDRIVRLKICEVFNQAQ